MRSTTAREITKVLKPSFTRYEFPFSIKTDNGPPFRRVDFAKYLTNHGVEHITLPLLWPQVNGEVERQNTTLLKTLKTVRVKGKDWVQELYKFLVSYCTTPQVTTGASPALMFGRELRSKLPGPVFTKPPIFLRSLY